MAKKKITLPEFIANCTDERIAIGTNHGGSFLYFGPPDFEAIQKTFDEYIEFKHNQLIGNYHKLEAMMFNKPNFTRTNDDSEYNIDMKLMDRACNMHDLYVSIRSCETWFANYSESFGNLDRKVVDVYKKIVDNCTAVIIDGFEQGAFMLYDEFVNRHSK